MNRKSSIIFFVLSLGYFLSGCKEKGCTDPNSINFNVTASVDDGSCLYCALEIDSSKMVIDSVVDNSTSSPHHSENVVNFFYKQVKKKYNFDNCGKSGCYLLFYGQNLVSDTILMTYSSLLVGYIDYSFSISSYLPPNQVTLIDSFSVNDIQNICDDITMSTLTILPGTIAYH